MRFIGDIHSLWPRYLQLITTAPASIQVGDIDIGYRQWPHGEPVPGPPIDIMREQNARFIRGNHDNLRACRECPQWIPDGHFENNMMFIGGGFSIDRPYRHEDF